MMNEQQYLSVRQVANAANISAQAVYQRLDKDLKPFVKTIKGRKMLSIEVLQLLGVTDAPTCQEQPKEVDKQLTSEENAEIERLQQEIQDLKQQLLDKQERIKELELDKRELELDKKLTTAATNRQISALESRVELLKQQNDILNTRLDRAETERERLEQNISNLTTALTAAQALHGMDKKQAAIEVKESSEQVSHSDQDTSAEIVPGEQSKQSFFARLFKRK